MQEQIHSQCAYFPKMNEGISFHLNPSECVIFTPQDSLNKDSHTSVLEQDRLMTSGKTAIAFRMDVINHDGFKILSLCDGTLTEQEILTGITKSTGLGSVADPKLAKEVSDFLDEARRRNHIVFLSERSSNRCNPLVTGSTDIFVPFHISFELTRRCNLACSYCYASLNPSNPDDELHGDRIIEILSDWIKYGLRGIEITGGEPFLHRDFWNVLNFCLENLESVALLSNGTLIDEDVVNRLAQHRRKPVISVSLDGCCKETHDRISGVPGSFERSVAAISSMVRKGFKVRVAMTVTSDNWREIECTLLLARDIGATWFGWAPFMPFGRGCNLEWDLTIDEITALTNEEIRLLESYRGFITAIPRASKFTPLSWNCGLGWKNVVVGPSGIVRPCLLFPESTAGFADLKKEGIQESFAKQIVFRLRQLPVPSNEICGDCRLRSYCNSCPARGLSNAKARAGECRWVHATKSEELVEMMQVP